MENKEMELDVLKKTVQKQSSRIAGLMLDLDLAYSQIEYLNEQLNKSNTKVETKAE